MCYKILSMGNRFELPYIQPTCVDPDLVKKTLLAFETVVHNPEQWQKLQRLEPQKHGATFYHEFDALSPYALEEKDYKKFVWHFGLHTAQAAKDQKTDAREISELIRFSKELFEAGQVIARRMLEEVITTVRTVDLNRHLFEPRVRGQAKEPWNHLRLVAYVDNSVVLSQKSTVSDKRHKLLVEGYDPSVMSVVLGSNEGGLFTVEEHQLNELNLESDDALFFAGAGLEKYFNIVKPNTARPKSTDNYAPSLFGFRDGGSRLFETQHNDTKRLACIQCFRTNPQLADVSLTEDEAQELMFEARTRLLDPNTGE